MTSLKELTHAKPSLQTQLDTNAVAGPSNVQEDETTKKNLKPSKRRKVNHACLYCRRSHMTCDDGRPCQRCIKREIGHLCHDERKPKASVKQPPIRANSASKDQPPQTYPASNYAIQPEATSSSDPFWSIAAPQPTLLYQPESFTFGNEFSVLTDFLETLDDSSFFSVPPTSAPSLLPSLPFLNQPSQSKLEDFMTNFSGSVRPQPHTLEEKNIPPSPEKEVVKLEEQAPLILAAPTKQEKFLLTAADQVSGSRDERLNQVIRSKYEAGLLKPYNYVKGYARLSRWMDKNVSQESKRQILQPLSILRPKFRAVAQSLKDIDLVFIEEAFERLLLDYDRVFSSMGVAACLWRRTGEIYKGNREFTELVAIDGHLMREGRLCIYELMAEESAVNYWEKYGRVAFDSTQKAVLTTCVLRYKPNLSFSAITSGSAKPQQGRPKQEGFISCCFSFTIRRDKYGIPSMIVGNFIKC